MIIIIHIAINLIRLGAGGFGECCARQVPVSYWCGSLREQTEENGFPRKPTGSLFCSYRHLRNLRKPPGVNGVLLESRNPVLQFPLRESREPSLSLRLPCLPALSLPTLSAPALSLLLLSLCLCFLSLSLCLLSLPSPSSSLFLVCPCDPYVSVYLRVPCGKR